MEQVFFTERTIDKGSNHHDYALLDAKGRKLGARVYTGTLEYVKDADQNRQGGRVCAESDLGVWFTYCLRSTRDGAIFGAVRPDNCYRTAAERDAKAAKALVIAKRLAARKFGK